MRRLFTDLPKPWSSIKTKSITSEEFQSTQTGTDTFLTENQDLLASGLTLFNHWDSIPSNRFIEVSQAGIYEVKSHCEVQNTDTDPADIRNLLVQMYIRVNNSIIKTYSYLIPKSSFMTCIVDGLVNLQAGDQVDIAFEIFPTSTSTNGVVLGADSSGNSYFSLMPVIGPVQQFT